MKTALTGLAVFIACGTARRCLERKDRETAEYAGGRVRLTALRNEKGAFGLHLPRPVLLALSGAALGAVWLLRRRSPVGAGLLLGGGASNFWERLRQSSVYDYVRFPKAPGRLKQYVFNLADFAILAGSLLLAWGRKGGN